MYFSNTTAATVGHYLKKESGLNTYLHPGSGEGHVGEAAFSAMKPSLGFIPDPTTKGATLNPFVCGHFIPFDTIFGFDFCTGFTM